MKKSVCIIVSILWCSLCNTFLVGQAVFQNTIGGNNFEYGYSLQLTPDGGAIIGGVTNSNFVPAGNGFDQYIVKTDSLGMVEWAKSYGTPLIEVVNDVYRCSDGGYIFGGYASVSGGGGPHDGNYVVRVNSNGDTLWSRVFSFKNKGGDCYALTQADDGNFIIANYTPAGPPDGFLASLIKLKPDGDTLWVKTYDGAGNEWFYGIDKTNDGGYILAGYTTTNSAGGDDFILLRTDSAGNIKWAKAYGGTSDDYAYGHCVKQTADGGFILVGTTKSFGAGSWDVLVIKTDSSGTIQWNKTYGGSGQDIGHAVDLTVDGGYIFAGYTKSWGAGTSTGVENIYLIKTNAAGDTLWTRVFGGSGSGSSGDIGYAAKQTPDGYLVSGRTNSFGTGGDIYLIKTDLNGNVPCNMYYTGTKVLSPAITTSVPVLQQYRGATIIHPATMVAQGGTLQNLCLGTGIRYPRDHPDKINVYPNPAAFEITVEYSGTRQIQVFDLLGRNIASLSANPSGKTIIDIDSFPHLFFIRTNQMKGKIIIKK